MRVAIIGLVTAILATPASAVDQKAYELRTAADLAALCGATNDAPALQMCHGYLVGVDQAHSSVRDRLNKSVYCLPQDGSVTRNSAAAAFSAWAAGNASVSGMNPLDGLLTWARGAYPCTSDN